MSKFLPIDPVLDHRPGFHGQRMIFVDLQRRNPDAVLLAIESQGKVAGCTVDVFGSALGSTFGMAAWPLVADSATDA